MDAETIIQNLTAYKMQQIVPGKTLVFLDEIQECPNARCAIKFLVEDGRCDYIEIAPGYMATEMNAALLDPENPRYQQITERIPANRWGTGDDMKGACIFLASHASDYLGGAIIPVDGGYLVK